MRAMTELHLSECVHEMHMQGSPYLKQLLQSIVLSCKGLKVLDLSRNSFAKDTLHNFLMLLTERSTAGRPGQHMTNLGSLQSLNLSYVNVHRDSMQALVNAIACLRQLRKLDVSGIVFDTRVARQILETLNKLGAIECLEISKTGMGSDVDCVRLIGEMIRTNKNLRALGLQGIGLTDATAHQLVDPMGASLHIEAVNFNHNRISNMFVQNLVSKLMANRSGTRSSQGQSASVLSQSSIMTDETGGNDEEILAGMFQGAGKENTNMRETGYVSLSFEGNRHVGDKGAGAIASLIQTQLPAANNLKIVNLNECGITNVGFDHLKQALLQRANLANSLNLTHVKITIERNNIEQIE